jgi:hypothetical protein
MTMKRLQVRSENILRVHWKCQNAWLLTADDDPMIRLQVRSENILRVHWKFRMRGCSQVYLELDNWTYKIYMSNSIGDAVY